MFSVSVVIPTYNSRQFVARAIDSVLNQTYSASEIVVVDDGSADGTGGELQRRYGARINYRYQPNAGPSAARNLGISLAKGRWVAFLDADDVWLPEKLELQVNALRSEASAVMAVCGCIKVKPDGTPVSATKLPEPLDAAILRKELRHRTVLPTIGVVVRKDVLDECGGFDVRLRCAEDRDLWMRIAARGPVVPVHQSLALQFVLPNSASTDPGLTLRDGLIVNRRASQILTDPQQSTFSRMLDLRSADARLHLSVALARSWSLCPWLGRGEERRRVGLFVQLVLDGPAWRRTASGDSPSKTGL